MEKGNEYDIIPFLFMHTYILEFYIQQIKINNFNNKQQ
jgi:hypothetical protein